MRRKEGILSSTLSPSWAHSLAPVVFSKGPSVQSWPVLSHTGMMLEPERNLASDGAHEHVLGLLPVLPSVVKNQPGNTGDMVQSPRLGRSSGGGNGNPLQYSILQYSLPWTEEPGRVQSMGSQRVGYDLPTHTNTFTLRVDFLAPSHPLRNCFILYCFGSK